MGFIMQGVCVCVCVCAECTAMGWYGSVDTLSLLEAVAAASF